MGDAQHDEIARRDLLWHTPSGCTVPSLNFVAVLAWAVVLSGQVVSRFQRSVCAEGRRLPQCVSPVWCVGDVHADGEAQGQG